MLPDVDNLWIKFRINCDGRDDLCIKILLLPVGGIFNFIISLAVGAGIVITVVPGGR